MTNSSSSTPSATPSPRTYDPNIDTKQDVYSQDTLNMNKPNTKNEKRKSLPKKKGTVKGSVKGSDYNEHVPIFSDDDDDDDDEADYDAVKINHLW